MSSQPDKETEGSDHALKPGLLSRPVLCLLPGLGGTGALFRWFIDATGWDTLVVSYGDEKSLDDFVQSACGQLPTDRSLVLVAESFSGPIAIRLIATTDRTISGLVLVNTFARPPWAPLLKLVRFLPIDFVRPGRLRTGWLRFWVGNTVGGSDCVRSDRWSDIVKHVESQDQNRIRTQMLALAAFDVRDMLALVNVPVLCLRGRRDRLIWSKHSRQIAAGLRNCSVAIVDGPHLLLQLQPKVCASVIDRFVGGLGLP